MIWPMTQFKKRVREDDSIQIALTQRFLVVFKRRPRKTPGVRLLRLLSIMDVESATAVNRLPLVEV